MTKRYRLPSARTGPLPTLAKSTSRTGCGPSSPAPAGRWRGLPHSCRGLCVSRVLRKILQYAAPHTSPTLRMHIDPRAPPISAYRYEANGEGSIDPGDLICAWRGTADALDFQEGSERLEEANAFHRLPASEQARRIELGTAITSPVGTHCDIVVKVDRNRGRIYAIGGNVVQAVTMTILGFTMDGDRMRLETPPEHPGAPRWFAVLRLNFPDAGSADLDSAIGELPS